MNFCNDNNDSIAEELRDPDVRRKYAIEYVTKGIIKGYLAYYNNQVVGWCNANDRRECLGCFGWRIISGNTQTVQDDRKIKSIFCFTVAPAMRGKHIASALLERVISDAVKDGYHCLESYPNKEETDMYYNFVGPKGLYEKYGFSKRGETECRLIYQKQL